MIIVRILVVALLLLAAPFRAEAQFNARQTWGGTATGATNAYALTIPNVGNMQALVGVPIRFTPNAANTGAATLSINGGGAVQIVKSNGAGAVGLSAREIGAGSTVTVVYDGTFFNLASTAASPPTDCTSIITYGGSASNSDNAAALNTAISELGTTGGCIAFPSGKFRFLTPITANLPNSIYQIRIVGAGQDGTILYWPNAGNGLVFNFLNPANSINVSDLTLSTGAVNPSSGAALTVNQSVCLGAWSVSSIRNVTFRGDDNNATFYWKYAGVINKASGTNWDGDLVYGSAGGLGNGLLVEGDTNCYSIVHNLSKFTCNSCQIGFTYGGWVQGVSITQSNFTNGLIGVQVSLGAAGVLAQLSVSDSQFGTLGDQFQVLAQVVGVLFSNNLIFVPAGHTGLVLHQGAGVGILATITGNTFTTVPGGNTNTGITNNGSEVMITGNTFTGMTTGVFMEPTASASNIQSNFYIGNTCGVFVNVTCVFAGSSGAVVAGGGTP